MGRIKTLLILFGRAAGESSQRSLPCSSWWEVRTVAQSPVDGWDRSGCSEETVGDGVFSQNYGILFVKLPGGSNLDFKRS